MGPVLFLDEESRNAEVSEKKRKGMYHDMDGRFTNRTTAEIAQLRKENKIYKVNYDYYKRINERLCNEIKEEKERVRLLELQIKTLKNEKAI